MTPIETVLSRIDAKSTGTDRWRACCPAHGGTNPSALSIGIGDNGAVLLRCWQGCDVEQIVGALGLDLTDLFPARQQPRSGSGPLKRRRLISAGQALDLLHDEAQIVALCAINIAHGTKLTLGDIERVMLAAGRVAYLRDEVMA